MADITTAIDHAAPDCPSRQTVKTVLAGRARGVFQGKILVRQAAQKTDGYQISQALLLDERSQFLAKPELEIYADDVKCSHGSTTGALDETALFYLRSRGIPAEDARRILTAAFCRDLLSGIRDQALREQLDERLDAALSRLHEA